MPAAQVVIIGAGIAGLVAAIELATRGLAVDVVERADEPGGKMRQVTIGDAQLDAGPTVLTMRWIFEAIFSAAGESLDDSLTIRPASILARHAWSADERLDLYADVEESIDAIGRFAGLAEAKGYRAFSTRARQIYETLETPFLQSPRPTPLSLARSAGFRGLSDLWRIRPFVTMWQALGEYFQDPRLRQLFARYATYCGSSPFLAPATLMLVANVEQQGVWLVEGGMHRLALALEQLAVSRGTRFHYGIEARRIALARRHAAGVTLADGHELWADAVIVNADTAAIADGRFGHGVSHAVPTVPRTARSLSAVTWGLLAKTEEFPLLRHNVFFSDNYAAEFDDIFRRKQLPATPTIYVCAQDRGDANNTRSGGAERLFCIVNAPPTGDTRPLAASEIEQCAQRTFAQLERCGLRVQRDPATTLVTSPTEFEQLFPSTGGALYGPASHGWTASFNRPGSRSRVPRLYLAGGSTHPGPGVPMAALSGRLAAASILADLASTRSFHQAAMPGGTSMP